jgi:hypothetical protein
VNGTQKTTNNKSAAAKLMISTLVVERIVGLAATTGEHGNTSRENKIM